MADNENPSGTPEGDDTGGSRSVVTPPEPIDNPPQGGTPGPSPTQPTQPPQPTPQPPPGGTS